MRKTVIGLLALLLSACFAAVPMLACAETAGEPALVQYGFLRCNTLPFTTDGIEILSLESTGRILTVTAANRSGEPLKAASLTCVCRNDAGETVRQMGFYLKGMDPDEVCRATHTMPEGTTSTEFTGAVLYPGALFDKTVPTVRRSGTLVNEVPLQSGGLTVIRIDRGPNSVTLTVRNDSGDATLGTSYFPYRCYDKDGVVVNSGRCFVNTMKNGEQVKTVFEVERNADMVLLGPAWVMRP